MSNKISGEELLQRLDRMIELLHEQSFNLRPGPLLVYKPNPRDASKGRAMKLELSIRPEFKQVNDTKYVEGIKGGLFLQIAQQMGPDDKGNPSFDWKSESNPKFLMKLGLADVEAILLGMESFRRDGVVPEGVRPIVRNKETEKWGPTAEVNKVGLVHKFDDDTTRLEMQFHPTRGCFLGILKKSEAISISLSLQNEISFRRYLYRAMDAFHDVNLR